MVVGCFPHGCVAIFSSVGKKYNTMSSDAINSDSRKYVIVGVHAGGEIR